MEKKKKIVSFEILRCIALLMVFNQHYMINFDISLYDSIGVYSFLWSGHFGVAIFFIISGFCIANSCFFSKDGSFFVSLKKLINRYIRFVVPVVIVCLITYLCYVGGIYHYVLKLTGEKDTFGQLDNSWWSVIYDSVWGILFTGETRFSYALWTMKYEWYAGIYLYLFLPVIRDKKIHIRYIFYLISGILAVVVDITYVVFLLGVVLADVYSHSEEIRENSLLNNNCVKYILVALGFVLGSYPSEGQASYWNVVLPNSRVVMQGMHTLGAVLVVISFLYISIPDKYTKKCIFIGSATYEMYVIHILVINILSAYMIFCGSKYTSVDITIFLVYIISVFIVMILGIILHKINNLRVM